MFRYMTMFCLLFAGTVRGQDPALHTLSATTLGRGTLEIGLGTEYLEKARPPSSSDAFSESRLFITAVHLGVADNVDLNFDWRGVLIAGFKHARDDYDWGDLIVSNRIRLFHDAGNVYTFGLLSAVKLPNTMYRPLMLGSNQTDYMFVGLFTAQFQQATISVNGGLSIVGDPVVVGKQDDVFFLKTAAVVPVMTDVRLFAELYGFTGYLDNDDKLVFYYGATMQSSTFSFHAFGSARLLGTSTDFGTGFDGSQSWSAGVMVSRRFTLSLP